MSLTLPHIDTMKPASDLCFLCQQLMSSIAKATHLTEEEKSDHLVRADQHLKLAKERDEYNKQIKDGKEKFKDLEASDTQGNNQGFMHYSYDFPPQLHFPNNAQQPSAAYFLAARKCQLFGVTCEPLAKQVNYLIDEADNVGKGANTTISPVHHFLEHHGMKVDHLLLHADNCVGQNKNNATIHHLCWRVSFMLPGHVCTRSILWACQEAVQRTHVDTMQCFARVAEFNHFGCKCSPTNS